MARDASFHTCWIDSISPLPVVASLPTFIRHIPQTPSPLRTSRNANLMSHPYKQDATTKSSPLSDQNSFSFSSPATAAENTLPLLTPDTTNSKNSDASIYHFPTKQSSTKQSRFEARARASSPQTQLDNVNALARDRRKSQFLDRIRYRRDEGRGTSLDDQILRMDFVRERKEWEARRAGEEGRLSSDAIEAEENDLQHFVEEAEMSPTEDKEIEELLSYLPSEDIRPMYGQVEPGDDYRLEQEFDDDEYDQLFEEMDVDLGGMKLSQTTCRENQAAPVSGKIPGNSLQHVQDTDML